MVERGPRRPSLLPLILLGGALVAATSVGVAANAPEKVQKIDFTNPVVDTILGIFAVVVGTTIAMLWKAKRDFDATDTQAEKFEREMEDVVRKLPPRRPNWT